MDNIDDIISKFKKILNNEIDTGLEELMSSMSSITIIDPDEEWKKLIANYYKLKHFKQYFIKMNCYSIQFKNLFSIFMEKIDTVNQIYMEKINLNSEDYPDIADIISLIKYNLDSSLNENDPFRKLSYVLNSYKNIIRLVEREVGEKHEEVIDPIFKGIISAKRRKH